MRNYGSVQIQDIYADGGAQAVSLTPAAVVQTAEFTIQAPKGGVEGNWPLAMNIVSKTVISVDQAESGGSAIDADELPVIIDSWDINSPLLGNTHPRDTYKGPIAKSVMEYFSAAYTQADGARVQIPATDGDNALTYYQLLPFANECFEKPHHFAPWLGWLVGTKVKLFLAPSTAIDAFSTGAVTETPCTAYMWAEYVVSSELIMPILNQWHLYEQPASGGTTTILQGVGTNNGLADVKDGSRLAVLLELTSILGLGGPMTADEVTQVTIPQLGMDLTQNMDAFFSAFWRTQGGHRGPVSINATTPILDRSGSPNAITSNVTGNLNSAAAKYIPYRWTGRDAQLTKILRFFGDLKVTRVFSSTPSSGTFRFVTNEMRELGDGKKRELIGRTGKKGSLAKIFSTGMPDPTDIARHPNKVECMPERVVF